MNTIVRMIAFLNTIVRMRKSMNTILPLGKNLKFSKILENQNKKLNNTIESISVLFTFFLYNQALLSVIKYLRSINVRLVIVAFTPLPSITNPPFLYHSQLIGNKKNQYCFQQNRNYLDHIQNLFMHHRLFYYKIKILKVLPSTEITRFKKIISNML